ncbi:MAG: DUF4097 family beta strand repeat-containing protein [Gammaproteobacteria bacterium]
MNHTRTNLLLVLSTLISLGCMGTAWADAPVTRTLYQMIAVPANANVKVDNLVGHMTVTQDSGSLKVSTAKGVAVFAQEMSVLEQGMLGRNPLRVTATVVTSGSQAEMLAKSVKLEVSTTGNQVTVHVHYPVDQYQTYRYNPPHTNAENTGQNCFLDIICVHGNGHSDIDYQGARVQVNENGGSGIPLYVDVAVQLPAGVRASFTNAVGLLEASNLANTLSLTTEGSDINAVNLSGGLNASTGGGDMEMNNIVSNSLVINTGGGDVNGLNLKGDVTLDTGGGDTDIKTIVGALHAITGGGDMHLSGQLSALNTLYARTDGGDLRVFGDATTLRTLDVRTSGGDAVLHVSNLSMHLEASASGGDVNIHLPDISGNVVSKDDSFSGDIGKAAGQGTIHSGGGDITVSGNQSEK